MTEEDLVSKIFEEKGTSATHYYLVKSVYRREYCPDGLLTTYYNFTFNCYVSDFFMYKTELLCEGITEVEDKTLIALILLKLLTATEEFYF
jgi:hypothetical protein